jgi:hypothetical protein
MFNNSKPERNSVNADMENDRQRNNYDNISRKCRGAGIMDL